MSPKSFRANRLFIFHSRTANGLKDHRVPSPGQANGCERHPGYPSPRTLRPERAKARNYIAYSYRFCPFRAPSGVSSHPGCRSLRSLALGLVLLPRWGVSLRLCVSLNDAEGVTARAGGFERSEYPRMGVRELSHSGRVPQHPTYLVAHCSGTPPGCDFCTLFTGGARLTRTPRLLSGDTFGVLTIRI